MQEQELKQLISELGLDPNDRQLLQVLQELLGSKPLIVFDEVTKQRLKQQLMRSIKQVQQSDARQSQPNYILKIINNINFMTMQKFMIPALVVAIVVVAGGAWYANQQGGGGLISFGGNQLLSDKYSMEQIEEGSFGDLSKVSMVNTEKLSAGGQGIGGGLGSGGNPQTTEAQAPGQMAGDAGASEPMIMPPFPDGSGWSFAYGGEQITDLPEVQNVIKRQKPEQKSSIISRLIRTFSFGLINLSKLQNPKVQHVSFYEDKELGYNVSLDLENGTVYMNSQWGKWPQPEYRCEPNYCGNFPQITEADMPSDEEAIGIAQQFVQDYNISLNGYGEPVVYEYTPWRIQYQQAEDKTNFYFPEQVSVMYPLEIEGQKIYAENGEPTGLTIMIDVRQRKVVNMYGLETKQYVRSAYKGETNFERILEIAKRGGYRQSYMLDMGDDAVLKLETPKIELVSMWYTKDQNDPGEVLLVPAMLFPVVNYEEIGFWNKFVMVPLVSELLDNENMYGGVMPMPMPAPDPNPVPMPVEPDNGIGDTPVSTEPNQANILPFSRE